MEMEMKMEVKGVEAMVIQKLKQLMNQESLANNKLIIHQLQNSLKNLQSFSNHHHISDVDRLQVVYEFEDEIEKFAFRVAPKKTTTETPFGFLTKQTLFFNYINAHSLSKAIKTKISTFPEHGLTGSSISGSSSAVWPIPKNPTPKWAFSTQSSELNLCVLYMTLFPKDFNIPVRRLLRLWVAEGIVQRSSEYKFAEDLAQKTFPRLG
ncbi:hypothetical protein OSB04_025695 [Centaurea solstitialis]|uniref:Disease resistance protein winged helix domain-containing protein n=1 Tax=Centaurea solstitialis TaxID=347529 RepID=A0AA38SW44_9ASTR|nr:hypothetical protein OSB04_025695 [Centaurea solstitialis]